MSETLRPVNAGAESLLYKYFPVLDHGFIALVDYMSTEPSIDRVTRISHASAARDAAEVERLTRYRVRHRHNSPSEFGVLVFHIRAPIFVARQWVRHRTASWSEMSGRYTSGTGLYYTPDLWRLQSDANKQGSGNNALSTNSDDPFRASDAETATHYYQRDVSDCYASRDWLEEHHVAHELSRIGLPQSAYTEWFWKIDLHNLLHFLGLRDDGHAQKEIRDYAKTMAGMVKLAYPAHYHAWIDYEVCGARFSQQEMLSIIDALNHCPTMGGGFVSCASFYFEQGKPTKGELAEFRAKLERNYSKTPNHDIDFDKALTLEEAGKR